MNFFQHAACNFVLEPPKGATKDECSALPVLRTVDERGIPHVMSFWKPTEDELKKLNAGDSIAFVCQGGTHPPMMLRVTSDVLQQ